MTRSGLRNRLPGGSDGSDSTQTPEAVLMDTVAHLQLEVEAMKLGPPVHQTLGRPTSSVQSKQVVFTHTKVPRFAGVTSWEQYRQVFDAIAQSNGWDDATAALQLLSHLGGDVLNVALLVPEARQATREIWIVWHRRLPFGILLTVVGCGRAMLTQRLAALVNHDRRELYR